MTPERWKQIEAVFEQGLGLAPAARPDFLARECGADEEVRREVKTLLASHGEAGALEHNAKALALREALLAEDPTNADYRRLLAISYQNHGDYLAWRKETRAALESFRQKLALDEQSLAADPANARARGDLGYSLQRIGDLLAELDDHAQALAYYRRALEMIEKTAADAPDDLPARLYRHSLDIMRDLRERGVLDAEEAPEVEAIARKVAECEAAMSL